MFFILPLLIVSLLLDRRPASLKKSDRRWHFLLQAGNIARQVRINVVKKICPVATRNFE